MNKETSQKDKINNSFTNKTVRNKQQSIHASDLICICRIFSNLFQQFKITTYGTQDTDFQHNAFYFCANYNLGHAKITIYKHQATAL